MIDPTYEGDSKFINVLGPLFVINLTERADRRKQFADQLLKLNASFDESKVRVFEAFRPETTGGFTSIGARGCFLSHLGLLKTALAENLDCMIVCEDDLNFTENFEERIPEILDSLNDCSWDIFYGGHHGLQDDIVSGPLGPVAKINPETSIRTTHFIVFRRRVFAPLIAYLEAILARPPGHPDGGPMHVDGAYSRFRAEHPDVVTLAALPPLGYQRASRTDIHPLRWFDRLPGVRDATMVGRRIISWYGLAKK